VTRRPEIDSLPDMERLITLGHFTEKKGRINRYRTFLKSKVEWQEVNGE